MSERNKAVVLRFLDEGVVAGNPAVIDEVCHPDVINHAAAGPNQRGVDGVKKVVGFSKAAQPDQKWTWKAVLSDGDLVVVYGVREIIEHWAVRDDLGLMQQLGVVAAPANPPQLSPPPSSS